jgi:TPR repeat protein
LEDFHANYTYEELVMYRIIQPISLAVIGVTVTFLFLLLNAGADIAGAYVELGALLKHAKAGSAEARNEVGVRYFRGQGVSKDYTEAVKWFQKAAGQGHAKAQFNLGLMYDLGRGVPKNYVKAAEWYRMAAEKDHAIA